MSFGDCKIYSDGSHYIAIPPTKSKAKRRKPVVEEVIEVKVKKQDTGNKSPPVPADENTENINYPHTMPDLIENTELTEQSNCSSNIPELPQNERSENTDCSSDMPDLTQNNEETRYMTRKELFEEVYKANLFVKKKQRRENLIEAMSPYFEDLEHTKIFVDRNIQRKERNLITRRVRMSRKINLQEIRGEFNYFCTFTYSDKLHDEESFKKKLRSALRHLTERRGWKYIGVWERSPEKQRLHFHGIFYIPDGGMVGELIEVKDYSVKKGIVQTTIQNTYFNERFGRSDFEEIEDSRGLNEATGYLMKYIEKTGEKIVYGGKLPQYFKSDVMDEDIICAYDEDSNKVILRDDFTCWDEGEKIGVVSGATIDKMPKCN